MIDVKINNHDGTEWDVSEIVSSITYKTSRIGKAGSLSLTLLRGAIYQSSQFNFSNGDVIRVRKNGIDVFYGYIFSSDSGRDEAIKLTAYDQIRYLMNQETYVFTNITVKEVIERIAKDFNLRTGNIAETDYRIPAMSEVGQKLLDIICKAITLTFSNTGKDYCLYDDFGALSLRNVDDDLLDIYIGDESLMYDYSAKTSIDSDTYNRIKLYKENNETKKREIYMAQDSVNIKRWGVLQLYQSVDEKMNEAQINELLKNLSILKNRESKSLKISAVGDIRIRAGMRVRIVIAEYGIDQNLLIDECTHNLDGADHTMSLELRVV